MALNKDSGVEEKEKQQKSETDLHNELIRGFGREYVPGLGSSEKNELIRDIMSQSSITGDIKTALEKYQATNKNFTGLKLSEITVYQLRNSVAGAFTSRKNNEELFKQETLKAFDISSDEYEKKVSKKIEKLDDTQLQQTLREESARDDELKKILGTLPSKKEQISILNSISEAESSKRLKRIEKNKGIQEKNKVLEIMERAKYRNLLNDADLQILIESGYFGESEIKELVDNFIPNISLQRALDLGLITEASAQGIRDTYIKSHAKKQGITLDATSEGEIQTLLSLSEILVPTSTLKLSVGDYEKIAKEIGFKNFEDDLKRKNEQIQEELRKNGPATFDLLKEAVIGLGSPNLEGFEKLQEGATLEFITSKDGEETKQYITLVSKDDDKRKFSFRKSGIGKINKTASTELESIDYVNFLENLKGSQSRIRVLTDMDVDTGIKSGDIESSELQSRSEEEFEGNDKIEKRSEIRQKLREQKERELENLKKELEQNPGSALYQGRVNQKQNEINALDSDISAKTAAESATFLDFLDKLNDYDSDGKTLGFEEGLFIETKENAFQIDGFDIENKKITLKGLLNPFEEMTFSEFIDAFNKNKAKRTKALSSVSDFIDRVSGPQEWGKVEFESKGLVQKDHKGQDPDQKIEYLTSGESDVLVKIIDIQDGYVEIQRGEQEDVKGKKEVEFKELKIKGVPTETYSLNEFATFIESEKLKPDWKLGKKGLEVEPDDVHNTRNNGNTFGGTMWKVFMNNRMSFSELLAGGKMVPELIEEYWKKGSDIKAAKAALAIGKFLPKEMRDELLVKVEKAEGESMEAALENLGKIDSPDAVKRIENWLLDKNTSEHNKEAGLLWMLQKYGHLTSKRAMYQYRGKWLWYEAFGGRVNDELFLRKKKEVEDDGQNLSEEYLMWMLMKEQCAGRHPSGIKRRGRLHKEFEGKFKSGIEEEFEKGYKDASSKRTAAKMVKEGMDEALGGTTTNALGWMKKAVERGGSLEDMMEISFCLLYSGAIFDVDQASYLRAKGLWDGDGQPIVSQRMMSSQGEMSLFNETVLALSKEIGEAYPEKYKGIAEEAQKIFNQAGDRSNYEEPKRLQKAQDFWQKYGKPLSRGLNMAMQPDSETSKTDTIIKRKKDNNSTFKKYYEKVSEYVEESHNVFKEDFIEDACGDTGVFGLNTAKIAEKFLAMDQGGAFKKGGASKKVWKRMYEDINSTPGKILSGDSLDSEVNKYQQKKYIVGQLEAISAGLLSAHGTREGILPAINSPTGHLGEQFNKWGINFAVDLGDVSAGQVKNGDKRKYFESIASKILSGATQDEYLGETPIELQVEKTKKGTSKATSDSDGLGFED